MTEIPPRHSSKKIKKRSFAALLLPALLLSAACASPSAAADAVLKVDISGAPSSAPNGWDVKEWRGKAEFEVVKNGDSAAIHLKSNRASGALYKTMDFDITDYPMLHWKWRVDKLPEGADVRFKHKDDQAAQIYVIFPKWPAVVNSRIIGYIWDTTAPAGAFIPSTKSSNTRYVVIRSGPEGLGKWFTEQRNVYEDYKKSFNEEPPPVGRVSVMIDSDDMSTTAESYFSDIYFSKTAEQR